jgi:nitrogen fixation/metabolism regulation signal transduction histidine kinase
MKFNRFKLRIFFQSLLIAVTGYFAVLYLSTEHLWITKITLVFFWVGLLLNLINYVTRTNRQLTSFLSSINHLDTIPENDDGDQSFRELNITLNQIISNIKEAKRDKEAQSVYFRNTLEHISTGLITWDQKGNVKMYNKSARQLLKLHVLSKIEGLSNLKKQLDKEILNLKPGENLLSSLIINGELHRIVFRKAEMKVLGEELYVLSMQDIRSQLEEEELEAWQKLISILRHEIMNSVAPLNSLGLSLRKILDKVKKDIPANKAEMLMEGLEAISRRSEGLMNFVQAYKTLTSIPKPRFSEFPVKKLIDDSLILFRPETKKRKIQLDVNAADDLMVTADYDLVSQVLINLVKNALEAVENKKGEISLEAFRNENGWLNIIIKDNGRGIPEDQINKIFIPFYTTRENGTGIGLSLARQIMRIHKGKIDVHSRVNQGTEFILQF